MTHASPLLRDRVCGLDAPSIVLWRSMGWLAGSIASGCGAARCWLMRWLGVWIFRGVHSCTSRGALLLVQYFHTCAWFTLRRGSNAMRALWLWSLHALRWPSHCLAAS